MVINSLKALVRDLFPPIAWNAVRGLLGRRNLRGEYDSWGEALQHTTGYDSDEIFKKVLDASLKVKNGEAAYERDSILFHDKKCTPALLAVIFQTALEKKSEGLNILDFGGSLGSLYFKNRRFFHGLEDFKWNIVEQEKFVSLGRKHLENGQLKFFGSIGECVQAGKPDIVVVSSVLQYLQFPYKTLNEIIACNAEYIFLDFVPLSSGSRDMLTVQHVPESIYNASYPFWIFGSEKIFGEFARKYGLMLEFDTLEYTDLEQYGARYRGLIMELMSKGIKTSG